MPLLDWEETETCPYNPAHQITKAKLIVSDLVLEMKQRISAAQILKISLLVEASCEVQEELSS